MRRLTVSRTAIAGALFFLVLVSCLHPADGFFQFPQQPNQQRPPPKKPAHPEVDYYAVLELGELREKATEADIKQSFRRLSRRHHPDVAKSESDKDKYAAINRAYEVLSDKRRRKMFDMRGEEGVAQLEELKRGGEHPGHGLNPFAQLFGIGGGGGGGLRGPDTEVRMEADLKTFFVGGRISVEVEKQQVCTMCRGSGVAKGSPVGMCPHCHGHGALRQLVALGPGMFQEVNQQCPHCQGTGRLAKHHCAACHGRKVVRGRVPLIVDIEAGAPEGHAVVFEMEAEEQPDKIPGDLTVRLFSRPHPRFQRRPRSDVDLDTTLHISLADALTGFETSIVHLDDVEKVVVRQPPGTITPYGTVMKLAGKGMPRLSIPSERGDLYVRIVFDLPKHLTQAQRDLLEKLP